jgi:hypothetical protein
MPQREPSFKRASQWLMDTVALERRLSLVWQGESVAGDKEEEEEERTAWWLLWCMGRHLKCETRVTEQEERLVYAQILEDPGQCFLDHVLVYGHRYFRYDEATDTLRVLRSAIPLRDQDWYPSYPHDPDQWLVVTRRVREHPHSLALLLLRVWRQRHDEYVRKDRWDLVKTLPELQQMAQRLIPVDSAASSVWTRLPACASKLQAKSSVFEAKTQLTIMLKQAQVSAAVAKELVDTDAKFVSDLYAKETHCWSCRTMQKKGYCPFVSDVEDLAAAKCLADYVVVTQGKPGKNRDKIGISPEAFIRGTS